MTHDEYLVALKPSVVMQETIGPVALTVRLKLTTTDHDFDALKVMTAYEQFRTAVIGAVVVKDV